MLTLVGIFFQGSPKKMLTKKRSSYAPIALEAPKLEGPRGKNPISLYRQSTPGHKQH
jgi:hypothetical protein